MKRESTLCGASGNAFPILVNTRVIDQSGRGVDCVWIAVLDSRTQTQPTLTTHVCPPSPKKIEKEIELKENNTDVSIVI